VNAAQRLTLAPHPPLSRGRRVKAASGRRPRSAVAQRRLGLDVSEHDGTVRNPSEP
jgi:hypothetical protein